jgi:hypothetical protein
MKAYIPVTTVTSSYFLFMACDSVYSAADSLSVFFSSSWGSGAAAAAAAATQQTN